MRPEATLTVLLMANLLLYTENFEHLRKNVLIIYLTNAKASVETSSWMNNFFVLNFEAEAESSQSFVQGFQLAEFVLVSRRSMASLTRREAKQGQP